jgi:hypothetical protein
MSRDLLLCHLTKLAFVSSPIITNKAARWQLLFQAIYSQKFTKRTGGSFHFPLCLTVCMSLSLSLLSILSLPLLSYMTGWGSKYLLVSSSTMGGNPYWCYRLHVHDPLS